MEQTTSSISDNNHLPTGGHCKTCYWTKTPNKVINEKRYSRCRDVNNDGKRCSSLVCMLGCVDNVNGELLGRCMSHYSKYCNKKGWDSNLSMCANKKCSEISYSKRKNINQYNINRILGLSGEKDCHHISKSRREDADSEDEYSDSESESDSETTPKKLPQRDSKLVANNTIEFINDIIHDYTESISSESSQAEKSDDDSSEEESDLPGESSSDSSFEGEEESFELDKTNISAESKTVFGARPNTILSESKTIFGARPNYASKSTPISSSCLQQ